MGIGIGVDSEKIDVGHASIVLTAGGERSRWRSSYLVGVGVAPLQTAVPANPKVDAVGATLPAMTTR